MPKRKVTDLGENEVIHCKTEEEAESFGTNSRNYGLDI